MEVIPAMDLLGGRVVRLHQGDYARVTVYADDPAEMLAAFVDAGARRVHLVDLDGARDGRVATRGWTTLTDRTAVDLARSLAALGATAVLYTDIARDGTGAGPNVEATARLAEAVPGVEVIASGGIGSLDHLRALAAAPAIAATVVGRALYERAFTVAEALAAGRGGAEP